MLAACRELNVALIAYSPLEQGLLTGKYRVSDAQAPQLTGARRFIPAFGKAQRSKIEPLLQTMEPIARAHDKTMAQVALNWLLVKDESIIPIPGAKNARQAKDNAGAIGWRLTPEEQQTISQCSASVVVKNTRITEHSRNAGMTLAVSTSISICVLLFLCLSRFGFQA